MILATGASNRRPRRAFTLIELILVMALLVVAVSIVTPHVSEFIRGRALDNEGRRMAAVAHAAQSRAISEGMPIMFWLDEKQGRYGIEEETPGKKGDSEAQNFAADENVQLVVASVGVGTKVTFKNLPAIRFLADGSVDEGSPTMVQIKDSGGHSLWLAETSNQRSYEVRDSNQ
jgi:prepilin-type N-terminal cleavage/methylation domain-containing protein